MKVHWDHATLLVCILFYFFYCSSLADLCMREAWALRGWAEDGGPITVEGMQVWSLEPWWKLYFENTGVSKRSANVALLCGKTKMTPLVKNVGSCVNKLKPRAHMGIIPDFPRDSQVDVLPGEVNKMVILETKKKSPLPLLHQDPMRVNHQILIDCQKSK